MDAGLKRSQILAESYVPALKKHMTCCVGKHSSELKGKEARW